MKKHSFTFFSRRMFARPWRCPVPCTILLAGVIGSLIISFYGGSRLADLTGTLNALIICSAGALFFFGALLAVPSPAGEVCAKIGLKKIKMKDLQLCVLALFIILPGSALLTCFWQQFLEILNIPFEKEQSLLNVVRHGNKATFLQLLVLTAGVIPCLEELIFRRGLYALLARTGPHAAMIVTALIFSVAHGFLLGVPALFFMGLTFQVICNVTRNLWCSIITHALLNATVLGVTFTAAKCGLN